MTQQELLDFILRPEKNAPTEAQAKAIMFEGGSAILSASAGSGKTSVLSLRVLRKLLDRDAPVAPTRLLVVTFTNAAAAEMRGRVEAQLKRIRAAYRDDKIIANALSELPQARICTIDSFCQALLREHFEALGVSPDFRIASGNELELLHGEVLAELFEGHYAQKNKAFFGLLDYFGEKDDKLLTKLILETYEKSRCQPRPLKWLERQLGDYSEGGSQAAAARWSEIFGEEAPSEKETAKDMKTLMPIMRAFYGLLAEFFAAITAAKRERNILDFSDVRLMTIELLIGEDGGQTELARALSEEINEIIIDEFQDVNRASFAIFEALSQEGQNLFLIGDVKQSIYGFQNADPSIFLEQRERMTEIILRENFRSRSEVTDFANTVMETCLPSYAPEALVPRAGYEPREGMTAEFLNVFWEENPTKDKMAAQARFIALKIREMVEAGGFSLGDFAVLYKRGPENAKIIERELRAAGLDCWVKTTAGYFESREIVHLLALLRAADNPRRDIDLAAVMLSAIGGFSPDELLELKTSAKEKGTPIFSLLRQSESEKAKALTALLAELRLLAAKSTAEELIFYIHENVMFYEPSGVNIRKLTALAREYEKTGGGLSGFLRYLARAAEKNQFELENTLPKNAEMVKLMTIHGSKGLEFPVVFLVGCEKAFDKRDISGRYIVSAESGVALPMLFAEKMQSYDSLPFLAAKKLGERKINAEEHRLLYVALTRAREKLFVLTSPPASNQRFASSFANTISAVLPPVDTPISESSPELSPTPAAAAAPAAADEAAKAQMLAGFEWVYPHKTSTETPTKLTVTKLTHREEDFVPSGGGLPAGGSPAGKSAGTATHELLQFANYSAAAHDLEAEISRLVAAEFITPENAELVNTRELKRFLKSPLFGRIQKADEVFREYAFLDLLENGETYIQGIADCVIREGFSLSIIDYKTDRVNSGEELVRRYGEQLRVYRRAIEKALGLPAAQMIIYSLALGEEIVVA